jgi:hypothetical protein
MASSGWSRPPLHQAAAATSPRASETAAARTTRPLHGDALRGRSASFSVVVGIVFTIFMAVLAC